MNIENIKALAEILTANGLTALEICEADSKIRLEKTTGAAAAADMKIQPPVITEQKHDSQAVDFNKIHAVTLRKLLRLNVNLVAAAAPEHIPARGGEAYHAFAKIIH